MQIAVLGIDLGENSCSVVSLEAAGRVRACGVRQKPDPNAALGAWLADARVCGVRAIETFAAGLELDGAAVRGTHSTLEQRPSRGIDHPAQADQAARPRPRRLRTAASTRSC